MILFTTLLLILLRLRVRGNGVIVFLSRCVQLCLNVVVMWSECQNHSCVLTVLSDSPVNITVTGINSDNSVDYQSTLSCSATAYPPPDRYSWTDTATSIILSNSASLRIADPLGPRTLRCSVSNVIRGSRITSQQDFRISVTRMTHLTMND
jgi:hypothetical protein